VLLALIGITFAAALLYTWNIGYSGLSTYYAAGAKSMSESWRAMFFGALNPSATTTLDKLSGFLVPQAIAIRLFGFHAWALSLPQAIEGVVTIVFSYAIGARWRGPVFGLLLAFLMAFTPMLAAMFGHPMEDGMLTMCTVLAFAAAQRAVLSGRFLWLLVAMAWVAVGFQAKMMQAWFVLPAIGIVWYLGTQAPRLARAIKLGIATVVVLVLSLSWMTAIQLVPSASRPYVDGTTNNNMFSMVFGYNGFDRLIPGVIPGAIPQLAKSHLGVVNTTETSDAGHSVYKLLEPEFSSQIGWLLPLALAGAVFVAIAVFGGRASGIRDAARSNSVAVGMVFWFLVPAAVLSVAFVPHATYFAQFAVPVGALSLYGVAAAVAQYRSGGPRGWLVLPSLIAIETAWELIIIWRSSRLMWFTFWPVAVLGILGVLLLVWGRLGRGLAGARAERAWGTAIAAGAIAIVLAPIVWSVCVIGPGGGGSASDAYAGPRSGPLSTFVAERRAAASRHKGLRAPFRSPPDGGLDSQQAMLYRYLTARNDGRRFLFASDSMPISVSFLLYTHDDVLPMGGFSRTAPDPGSSFTRDLLASGALRFVLLNGNTVADQVQQADVLAVRRWVTQHCRPVLSGEFRQDAKGRQELYDCSSGTG